MSLSSFPKIFAVGTRNVKDIFQTDVEITEKVDGSQFVFGKTDGELVCRSKGAIINLDEPEKMFSEAVNTVKEIGHLISDNNYYYTEYLRQPKHNTLAYNSIPEKHLVLFGWVVGDVWHDWKDMFVEAERIGISIIPVIYEGLIDDPKSLFGMIERESFLGGQNIEGVIVKNYSKDYWIADRYMPVMAGKYVSEKFKEVHQNTWKKEHTGKGKWEVFIEIYRTEARWEKAVQHLKEVGDLDFEPRDIGYLIKEVKKDIVEEEKEIIKDFLWKQFSGELLRVSTHGLPEWYKDKLVLNEIN